jgi:hypothetical protein
MKLTQIEWVKSEFKRRLYEFPSFLELFVYQKSISLSDFYEYHITKDCGYSSLDI